MSLLLMTSRQAGPGFIELPVDTLTGARLEGLDLRRAYLNFADLRGATLTRCDLRGVRAIGASLRGARLERCALHQAFLEGADLQELELIEVGATYTRLVGADLRRARLNDAVLELCNFDSALLHGADLSGAELRYADLARALFDAHTRWPADLDPEAEQALRAPEPARAPGADAPPPEQAQRIRLTVYKQLERHDARFPERVDPEQRVWVPLPDEPLHTRASLQAMAVGYGGAALA